MLTATFAGRNASHHICAEQPHLAGMEGALSTGDALDQHLGALVDQDRHQAAARASSTAFRAPSTAVAAGTSLLPSSSLSPASASVPAIRTTMGTRTSSVE